MTSFDGTDEMREICGVIVSSRPCITDPDMINELSLKGFGYADDAEQQNSNNARLFLESFEALFLLHSGRLKLLRGRQFLTFDSFLSMCYKSDPDILTRFLIYRDLRSRGYVAKDGFGFGVDFRVYERGQFGHKGSKLLVFGLVEGQPEKMGKLQKKIREIMQMGKEPIMAVVDRHGEIIYYKINSTELHENKQQQQHVL